MSNLEDSIKALAESNMALAKAQTYYADTINKFGLKVENDNKGSDAADKTPDPKPKTETAAQKKKREAEEAAAAKEAEGDDDGFGEEAEVAQEAFTADDVKKKLLEVKDANGGDKTPAIEIIKKYGYAAIPEVQAKDYASVVKDCDKWIKANA